MKRAAAWLQNAPCLVDEDLEIPDMLDHLLGQNEIELMVLRVNQSVGTHVEDDLRTVPGPLQANTCKFSLCRVYLGPKCIPAISPKKSNSTATTTTNIENPKAASWNR